MATGQVEENSEFKPVKLCLKKKRSCVTSCSSGGIDGYILKKKTVLYSLDLYLQHLTH